MLCFAAFAQDEKPQGWSHKGNIGINLGQSSYTNWAAGGQNSLTAQGMLNYEIHYLKNKFKWDNSLSLSLGYCVYSFKQKPVKTDDVIEFTSLAAFKATEKLNYGAELSFRSQFAKGFDYAKDSTNCISKFLAPAYITLGLGIEWVPNKYFSLYFAPVTGRVTIVNDPRLAEVGAYGVEPGYFNPNDSTEWIPGKKVRYEFGARAVAKFQYPIAKNIDFNTKLELFSDYLPHYYNINGEMVKKCRPYLIDVDWQAMLVLKVNDWLNCNLSTHLIYDYDTPFYDETGAKIEGSKVQFKEVLAIGFLVNLK